jgi:hypothetical protein
MPSAIMKSLIFPCASLDARGLDLKKPIALSLADEFPYSVLVP